MAIQQGRILTAEQLVVYRSRTEKFLPTGGSKQFTPSHSWLEKKQIRCALDERKDLLEEERVEKLGSLAIAEWKEEFKLACVTRRVGRHFESLGHEQDATLILHPEEALYLVETSCLELLYEGVAMSVQQGYNTLLGPKSDCTLNEYRVFSHLLRQGYRLLRHSSTVRATRYELQIGLHRYTLGSKQKNRRTSGTSEFRNRIKSETSVGEKSNEMHVKEEVKIEPQEIIEVESTFIKEERGSRKRRKRFGRNASVEENSNRHGVKREIEVLDICNSENSLDPIYKSSTSEVEIIDDESDCNIILESDSVVCNKVISTRKDIEEINVSDNENSNESEICSVNSITSEEQKDDEEDSVQKVSQQIIKSLVALVCSRVEANQSEVYPSAERNGILPTTVTVKNEAGDNLDNVQVTPISTSEVSNSKVMKISEDSDSSKICGSHGSILSDTANGKNNNAVNSSKTVENASKLTDQEEAELPTPVLDPPASNIPNKENTSNVVCEADEKSMLNLHHKNNSKRFHTQDILEVSDNSMSSISEVKIEFQKSDTDIDIIGDDGGRGNSDANVIVKKKDSVRPDPSHSVKQELEIIDVTSVEPPAKHTLLDVVKHESQSIEVIDIDDDITDVTPVKSEPYTSIVETKRKRSSSTADLKQINALHGTSKRRTVKNEVAGGLCNQETIADDTAQEGRPCEVKLEEELSKFYEEIELIDLEEKDQVKETEDKKMILDTFTEESEQTRETEDKRQILDSFPNVSGLLVVNLTVPPTRYLPHNVCPDKSEYNIDVRRLSEPGIGACPEPVQNFYRKRENNNTHYNNYRRNGGYHRSRNHRKRPPFSNRYDSPRPERPRNATRLERPRSHQPWPNAGSFMNICRLPQQPLLPFPPEGYQPHPAAVYAALYPLGQFGLQPQVQYSFPPPVQPSWPSPWLSDPRNQVQQHHVQMYSPSTDRPTNATLPLRVEQENEYTPRTTNATLPLRVEQENEYTPRFNANEEQFQTFQSHDNTHRRYSRQEYRKEHPGPNHSRFYSPPRKLRGLMQYVNEREMQHDREGESNVPSEESDSMHVPTSLEQIHNWTELKQRLNNNVNVRPASRVIENMDVSEDVVECLEIEDYVKEEEGEVDEPTPLLKPADCTNIGNILNKLQIIRSTDSASIEVLPEEVDIQISYDVYLPNSAFRKSNPPLPDYRLAIVGYECPIPSQGKIAVLLKSYEDGVPLLIAVVLPDSIAFFNYSVINLPTYSDNLID